MNDSAFVNYDNYYYTPSYQVTDSLVQGAEYEEILPNIQYINNGPCDLVFSSQATTTSEQRHQQSNIFTFVSQSRKDQELLENTCTNNRVASANNVALTGPTPAGFGNIPFVQIHTTDVQPQRTSYGNVFRRNINKQEEIKSEPIKSESNDASKERSNTTPTPPRAAATNATQNCNNLETSSTDKQQSNNDTTNIEEISLPLIQIYKCSKCAFISLNEMDREDHFAALHGENNTNSIMARSLINCPGCSNIFYAEKSLQIHLQLDHSMKEEDVIKLTTLLLKSNNLVKFQATSNQKTGNNSSIEHDKIPKEPLRKSRIYLRNVDCLREPNRHPMEQTANQLGENTSYQNSEYKKPNVTKQKISIKSVDVLREPALLRRDYEIQNSNVNNFAPFNTDLLNSNIDLINTPMNLNTNSTAYEYDQHLDNISNNTNNLNDNNNLNNNNESPVPNGSSSTSEPESNEKPRRPKIYVKSVESFNLMPLDTLHTRNNKDFSNNHNNLCNSNQVYDSSATHLPYMYDSNKTSNNLTNNVSFMNSHNELDTYQFINTSAIPNNNFVLENTLFLTNNEELTVNSGDQMENANFITDNTTPTPPSTNDISLSMNKPQTHSGQEQRGTLHLRTVDELNLMNKTEVQHLIAPNLDNNHNSNEIVVKGNSASLNDINLIGDELYEDDNFKFHDLDTQMVNDWPATYDDLAEDINCIIADASSHEKGVENIDYTTLENSQKMLGNNSFDIDTPQISLISIRDIEELTGVTASQTIIPNSSEHPTDLILEHIQNSNNELSTQINIVSQETLMPLEVVNDSDNGRSNLKRELVNATPESNDATTGNTTTKIVEQNYQNDSDPKTVNVVEMPPLIPVTCSAAESSKTSLNKGKKDNLPNTDIPVPPLVPVSPLVKLCTTLASTPPAKPASPIEKGRIYVANNLMEPTKLPVAVSATSGTSVRGRPFGSNRTRITKLKQTIGSSAEDLFAKCSIKGCAFRFKKSETVEYHRKCHDMTLDSPQAMLCPECNSKEYNNWNTLHTHLWRAHKVDMELYKCELCEFKTPIFSRLVNTHAKIHFNDRNYKCEQCEKAFKNSKQLKNHRRWHRVQASTTVTAATTAATPPIKANTTEIHRCVDCGSTFAQQKTLREHCCKKGESSLKCSICEKLMSSKSSLKLHLLTHSDGEKRYKCQNCDYASNDHNAFRRHRMGHENRKMYDCNFCSYKSVQSVAYQKHILQKHPEKADSVIHKCSVCSFSTINRSLLIVHQAKHDTNTSSELSKTTITPNNGITVKVSENSLAPNTTELQKSKIKVKRNLFTNNMEIEENVVKDFDENVVQLYTFDSGSVT